MKQISFSMLLYFLLLLVGPASAEVDLNPFYNVSASVDLGSPQKIDIANYYIHNWEIPPGLFFVCRSTTDATNGRCPFTNIHNALTTAWWHPTNTVTADNVELLFTEQRTKIKQILRIKGTLYWYQEYYLDSRNVSSGFIGVNGGSFGYANEMTTTMYIPADELRKLPFGGIWKAHLNLISSDYAKTGLTSGASTANPVGTLQADITLNITDNHNIRIWLPQFHGSTANVVMPLMPAYWALNKPGQVSAEKIVETCLYDGYSSNSQRFEVTLNSNYTDSSTQDFLLQNTSVPTSSPLHYQVIASPPGQPGTMQHLNPGVTQTYAGINTTGIRMVMMPGLQTPVACVPWPIRIKLLPFDLSRQTAGHYSGTLSVTFTPSLD
ncbi:CFA/I fimbrial subunit E (Colonization factor antigen I subunit E) [Escherichia coli M605]|uniref:CFA/I fimbrial subunit E (Colonization factor antigen I subunit E) n=1 Tax=Escherichia coli M605 TaxID=656417 RepID=F4SYH3_ECOLX|nr:CfaE/CblD family pilus tip adhesin [Escherichia coli]EGI16420.1 CFA/I fimbrial subunit E (Colonization factor antigen I subunit E) [Escherichia coli M605]